MLERENDVTVTEFICS